SLTDGRKFNFGLFCRLFKTLQNDGVAGQLETLFLLEALEQPINNSLIEIVAAQLIVAVGRFDLQHLFGKLENCDVESASAEVENDDIRFLLQLVQAVGKRRCSRFVDDSDYIQSGNLSGVSGGKPL